MWRDLSKAFRELRRALGGAGGSYRPDLYYMRGPGPKWHAKYGNLAPKASPNAASTGPGLHDLAERRA